MNLPPELGGYEDRLAALGGVPKPFLWPRGGTWKASRNPDFANDAELWAKSPLDSIHRLRGTQITDVDPREREMYDPLRAKHPLLLGDLGDLGSYLRASGLTASEENIERVISFTTVHGPLRKPDSGIFPSDLDQLPSLFVIFREAERLSVALDGLKAINSGEKLDRTEFIDGYTAWVSRVLESPNWQGRDRWLELREESDPVRALEASSRRSAIAGRKMTTTSGFGGNIRCTFAEPVR